MSDAHWIDEVFAAIDRREPAAFAAFFAPDGVFRFGNFPPVSGRQTIADTVAAFFAAVRGLQHRIEDRWLQPDAAIATGNVTYTRHDGSTLHVPFAVVMKLKPGGISEYLIFVDNSALFASPAASG